MGFIKRIFGGGGGNMHTQPTKQTVVQQPTTPTPQQPTTPTPQQTAVAAPVAESAQGNMQTGIGDTTLRKRLGKSALIIPNASSNTGSNTGGGLNV